MGHSLFFFEAIEGLKGAARDAEDEVTWDSLSSFVRKRVPRGEALPNHFRWLVSMLPEAEQFGQDLCWLMQRLEVQQLIFAAPDVGRIFRPLCRALGVEPTDEIRTPRPPPPPSIEVTYVPEAPPPRLVQSDLPDDGTGPLWTAEEEFWTLDENKWVHPKNRY